MLACSLWAVTSYQRMTASSTGRVAAQAGRLPTSGVAKNRGLASGLDQG